VSANTRLRIVAVGNRMPAWVQSGFEDYRKRLPRDFALELREIPLARRGADTARGVEEEGRAVLAALGADDLVVALEVGGEA
jgi:23S rRNA (pseudouridine1915-N3)-methyltransferase